jgi:hypothetical protein
MSDRVVQPHFKMKPDTLMSARGPPKSWQNEKPRDDYGPLPSYTVDKKDTLKSATPLCETDGRPARMGKGIANLLLERGICWNNVCGHYVT